ncbi:type 1 glutamine amidotransferase domain-containing protein [Nocardia sp. NPDC051832]|uniref:type 1 glutamine amidotransferase domain-containing protein n=1 Tax=Nocardia sp. NPDC051832 TaxID=3155673 RepID=UPI00343190A4
MSGRLEGVRVLIVTSNTGVERDELVVPLGQLRALGAQVIHAAPKNAGVQTFRHDTQPDDELQPDASLDDVQVENFEVLLIPGGTVNADKLRLADRAVALAKDFAAAGKPIAAICHGPWLLVEAGLVAGKTLTSYQSVRTDITNAGGKWVDQSAVRSPEDGWTLITSRDPGDLGDFLEAISEVAESKG